VWQVLTTDSAALFATHMSVVISAFYQLETDRAIYQRCLQPMRGDICNFMFVCVRLCLCVHALKGKQLELYNTKPGIDIRCVAFSRHALSEIERSKVKVTRYHV